MLSMIGSASLICSSVFVKFQMAFTPTEQISLMDRNYSAVLVGVGNIGRALVENFCFEQYGFTLKAAFDRR